MLSCAILLMIVLHNANAQKDTMISPLQQVKIGIAAQEVQCKEGFMLLLKAENGSPACVKPETVKKLVERGWGHQFFTQLSISGLEETYKIGNSIQFYIDVRGYGFGCSDGTIVIYKMNDTNKSAIVSDNILQLCKFQTQPDFFTYHFPSHFVINSTGSFILKVSYLDQTITKEIHITQ